MHRLRRLTSRCVAFVMAIMLICSGFLDNLTVLSQNVTGNVSGTVTAEAAETGTVNADTFSWDNASVYFLLTDRFKNGNTANDHSYNRGLDANGNAVSGIDDRGTFHGGDFAGITQTIKDGYFNDLGVNALWISAPYEQIHGYIVGGDGSPSFAHYSYHGYYVLDYTNSDANFGTMEEFKTLVDTAHEHGIRVIMDIVLNHAGYNSLYDMNEYGFGDVKDGWDSYYYSHNNVNNKDYHSYIDYEADASIWGKWWGGSWVRAGLPGYTEGGGDNYTMSLAGLPDFKTESTATVDIPEFLKTKWKQEGRYEEEVAELKNYLSSNGYAMTVTNCISYWLSTWVREYGVDGFRCDTAKHVELSSWKTLNTMCTEALKTWKANNPDKKLDDLDFWMTGECWDHKLSYDGYYTEANFDSMINFDTTGAGVLGKGTVAGKYEDYAGMINTKDDFNVLSYISSHDSTLARGDMIYIGSAFLMLPGGVQIYYGDETNRPLVDGIPFDGNGGAGHSLRSDMNWDSMDEAVLSHWQKVGTFRNNHIAVGAGANTTVESTSGVAFTRTYAKGNIKDRVAGCIGADANTSVTIDVSNVWNDGDSVVNYYDSSSAVVTNGKVTFNSGANGTILIQDPDGKPLVSFEGAAKFKGTQKVTVKLQETEQAVVSVDGAKKFIVKNGDTFTIGATAYEGDTVTIAYTASNDKGTVNGKATFYKAYEDEDIDGPIVEEKAIVHVKMADGSAPYLHAWQDSSTGLTGAWPGIQLTELGSDGYYVYDLDTTGTYNVIFNGGSGKPQTGDITGLKGEIWFDVSSDFATVSKKGGSVEEINNTVTIHVKPYSNTAPHVYIWDNNGGTYNGGFPGKQLTNPDADGWYTFTQEKVASLNCIIGDGTSTNRTGDITGITGEAWITITSADNTKYEIEKTPVIESKYTLLKKEARSVKNMTSSDYTSASWNNLYAYIPQADTLIALGEENADNTEVALMYENIVNAKAALVLATPSITSATAGSRTISGKAAYGANITVTLNGRNYTAVCDEITGVWTTTVNSLSSTDIIYVTADRSGLSSGQLKYDMAGNHDVVLSALLTANGSTSDVSTSVGSSVDLAVSASGGAGNYMYKFVVHNLDNDTWFTLRDYGSSATYTSMISSAGNKEFVVSVKDGNGSVVTTNKIRVTASAVTGKLTGTLKVNGSTSGISTSVGSSVKFDASASGGAGNYMYKFVVHNLDNDTWFTLRDYGSSATYTSKISSAGNKEFVVSVKDGNGTIAATNKIRVTASAVTGSLTGTLKVNGSTSDISTSVGSSVQLDASASGGAGNYMYKFVVHNLDNDTWFTLRDYGSSATYTSKISSAGNKEFVVSVKDGNGTIAATNKIRVTAATGTLTASLKGNGSAANIITMTGSTVKLDVSASGGVGNYTYKYVVHNLDTDTWYTLKDYGSVSSYTTKLASAGNKEFVVSVKDAGGKTVTTNKIKVTVIS